VLDMPFDAVSFAMGAKSAGGGGGGGGVLMVTVAWDDNTGIGTCDKTADEMWAAFPNICLKMIDDGVYYDACMRAQHVESNYAFTSSSETTFYAETASDYPSTHDGD